MLRFLCGVKVRHWRFPWHIFKGKRFLTSAILISRIHLSHIHRAKRHQQSSWNSIANGKKVCCRSPLSPKRNRQKSRAVANPFATPLLYFCSQRLQSWLLQLWIVTASKGATRVSNGSCGQCMRRCDRKYWLLRRWWNYGISAPSVFWLLCSKLTEVESREQHWFCFFGAYSTGYPTWYDRTAGAWVEFCHTCFFSQSIGYVVILPTYCTYYQ